MNTTKWIDVNKELPVINDGAYDYYGKSELVLACNSNTQLVAYLRKDSEDGTINWISNCSEGWCLSCITHWMPLPAFPE